VSGAVYLGMVGTIMLGDNIVLQLCELSINKIWLSGCALL